MAAYFDFSHFKGEEAIIKRLSGYKSIVTSKHISVLTKFLSPREQVLLEMICQDGGCQLQFSEGNERKRACLYSEDPLIDFEIKRYEVIYNHKFGYIRHQDVLGAMVGLGISTDCFGDINTSGNITISVIASIAEDIEARLKKIGSTTVKLALIANQIEPLIAQLEQGRCYSKSLRLDAVLAAVYSISRKTTVSSIEKGLVKVNHRIINNSNYLCMESDLLSLRHFGRVRLNHIGDKTKKGNHHIQVEYFR